MFKSKILTPLFISSFLLMACSEEPLTPTQNNLTVDMGIPASMTGGNPQVLNRAVAVGATGDSGQPCSFIGIEDGDPFRNGYQTTRFMVSVMATWTCIADLLIDVSDFLPHNGIIVQSDDNDFNAPDYDADEPTHYSVSDESATQVTVRLYYGYERSSPPTADNDPEFYISWNESADGTIDGRMIIDGTGVDWDDHDPDDPAMIRMDFNFTDTLQTADMYMQFDDNNLWANGFRIQITKDLIANPLQQVFVARGLIKMKAQFIPATGISEVPDIHFYTVSDRIGNGAAIAKFINLSLPLELNAASGNHLGNYLFTKKDIYFFEEDQDWDYINKSVILSELRGARTTPANGGSWVPFDPSIDLIISGLGLDPAYFTAGLCATVGDDCNDLLNTIHNYTDGFADQEPNQGSDPMDWRSDAIDAAQYLETVFPNGVDWTNAFDLSFTPMTL